MTSSSLALGTKENKRNSVCAASSCRSTPCTSRVQWGRFSDGNAERTSLPAVQRCVGDIGNMNGRLTCSYAGAPTPPQPYYGEPRGGAPDYGGYAPPSYGGYAPPGYGR